MMNFKGKVKISNKRSL